MIQNTMPKVWMGEIGSRIYRWTSCKETDLNRQTPTTSLDLSRRVSQNDWMFFLFHIGESFEFTPDVWLSLTFHKCGVDRTCRSVRRWWQVVCLKNQIDKPPQKKRHGSQDFPVKKIKLLNEVSECCHLDPKTGTRWLVKSLDLAVSFKMLQAASGW